MKSITSLLAAVAETVRAAHAASETHSETSHALYQGEVSQATANAAWESCKAALDAALAVATELVAAVIKRGIDLAASAKETCGCSTQPGYYCNRCSELVKAGSSTLFTPAEIEALVAAALGDDPTRLSRYEEASSTTAARNALQSAIVDIGWGRIGSSPWFVTNQANGIGSGSRILTLSKGRVRVAYVSDDGGRHSRWSLELLDPKVEAATAAKNAEDNRIAEREYSANLTEARRLLAAGEVLPHFEGQEGGTVVLPSGKRVSANGALRPFGVTPYTNGWAQVARFQESEMVCTDADRNCWSWTPSGFVCLDWAGHDARIEAETEAQILADRVASVARSAREMQLLGY